MWQGTSDMSGVNPDRLVDMVTIGKLWLAPKAGKGWNRRPVVTALRQQRYLLCVS